MSLTTRSFQYEVRGANAAEVAEVARELERQRLANQGPWRAGLFYLTCLVTITVVILAASKMVPLWALPVVVIAALISLVVLGALQLRQDGKVSEKNLLQLITAAFRTARQIGPAGSGQGQGPV